MLHPSSLRSTLSTPHSSGFASLDLRLFTNPSEMRLFTGSSILGDAEFARSVLDRAQERLEECFQLKAQGYDLDKVTIRVASELGIDPAQVWAAGKHPMTVKACSLLCYWAVRKLGFSATELSRKLGISQPSVSISVKRGERIAKAEQLELV